MSQPESVGWAADAWYVCFPKLNSNEASFFLRIFQGNIPSIPYDYDKATPAERARGYPGLCLEDSPTGIRFADLVTVFPAGINAAAS